MKSIKLSIPQAIVAWVLAGNSYYLSPLHAVAPVSQSKIEKLLSSL
jgi:hypothetical protein